jgi:glutathione S-transferase
MATRIALYEISETATFLEVDPKTKTLVGDGSDFRNVNPLGLVPVLRTDDGLILTENAAILQHVADSFPGTAIAVGGGIARTRLQQWLCFIGTELHKGLFTPLLTAGAPDEVRRWTFEKFGSRLDHLDRHLEGRAHLFESFSVADAYLVTVLNWTQTTPEIDLARWRAISAYNFEMRKRPSVARALTEEFELFKAEKARHVAVA